MKKYLISCCLLGIPCQYNGQLAVRQLQPELLAQLDCVLIPVCPEQLGGLSTPRKPCDIQFGDGFDVLAGNARVKSEDGEDFTEHFIKGAQNVLAIAKILKGDGVITQKRSPSCSCAGVYDGTFTRHLIDGYGVTAALLKQNGFELIDLDDISAVFACS
ncbi:MAG: DUF523 domain-containing protein [Gammaproteobacteria bacterium]|nr:DUF523 domain-containing protein [Gammaproteobacteria bacterium]